MWSRGGDQGSGGQGDNRIHRGVYRERGEGSQQIAIR